MRACTCDASDRAGRLIGTTRIVVE